MTIANRNLKGENEKLKAELAAARAATARAASGAAAESITKAKEQVTDLTYTCQYGLCCAVVLVDVRCVCVPE